MPMPYVPEADTSLLTSFTGVTFNDPGDAAYAATDPDRVDALYFLNPVQSLLLTLAALYVASIAVLTKTADYTLLAADNLKTIINTGAAGTVVITLPAATVGKQNTFYVSAAQILRAKAAGTDTIQAGASVSIAAGYVQASAIGSLITLRCLETGKWVASEIIQTWTVETS